MFSHIVDTTPNPDLHPLCFYRPQVRGYERRPILVLRKRKLSKILNAWYALAAERRSRRLRGQKAARFFMQQQYVKAWNAWREHAGVAARRKVLMAKTAGRVRNIKMAQAWETWAELIGGWGFKFQNKESVGSSLC